MSQDKTKNIPAISNTAAAAISGGLISLVSAWQGSIPFLGDEDFSSIKAYILPLIPGLGMLVAFGMKTLGFKMTLGRHYRRLSSINEKKLKKTRAALKDKDLDPKDREKFQKQLAQYLQDDIDIETKQYAFVSADIDRTEQGLGKHQATDPYANKDAQTLIEENNSPNG